MPINNVETFLRWHRRVTAVACSAGLAVVGVAVGVALWIVWGCW